MIQTLRGIFKAMGSDVVGLPERNDTVGVGDTGRCADTVGNGLLTGESEEDQRTEIDSENIEKCSVRRIVLLYGVVSMHFHHLF